MGGFGALDVSGRAGLELAVGENRKTDPAVEHVRVVNGDSLLDRSRVERVGQMGDLDSIGMLSELMTDEKARHGARGAAAVALGLICDPEERPSLSRLWEDVNYPARTVALHEALNYF